MILLAIQNGGRWAEVGPYYDFPNDPVTLHFLPGRGHGQSVTREFERAAPTALLQPSAVGATSTASGMIPKGGLSVFRKMGSG